MFYSPWIIYYPKNVNTILLRLMNSIVESLPSYAII